MRNTPQPRRSTQNAASGPEPLSEILSRLFTARGWGRRQDRLRLEDAWSAAMIACGLTADQTHPGGLRRGVLEVIVGNGVLMQEMAHFHKRRLLEQIRQRLPGTTVTDLRFRAGVVNEKS
jgi:predicted nucleic acid-binding Zn ribbon protein